MTSAFRYMAGCGQWKKSLFRVTILYFCIHTLIIILQRGSRGNRYLIERKYIDTPIHVVISHDDVMKDDVTREDDFMPEDDNEMSEWLIKAINASSITNTSAGRDVSLHVRASRHAAGHVTHRAARVNMTGSWVSYFYGSSSLSQGRIVPGLSPQGRILRDIFRPALRPSEIRTIRDLLDRFHQAMTSRGLFYIICSGTLLGSYRYHGVIPWDDDADVYVMQSDMTSVRDVLATLPDDYRLVMGTEQTRWKFYRHSRSSPISGVSWRHPFLDISFLNTSTTHAWDSDPGHAQMYYFKLNTILPVTLRPFLGLLLHAPRDTTNMLSKTYKLGECQSNSYSHRRELWVKPDDVITVDCRDMHEIYPYVSRDSDVTESLVYRNRTLYTIKLPQAEL